MAFGPASLYEKVTGNNDFNLFIPEE